MLRLSRTALFFSQALLGLLLLCGTAFAQSLPTIDQLSKRTYGSGTLALEHTLSENSAFTRYLVRYPSDGLQMYGFMDVPVGKGPFPVVIVIHGHVNPATYRLLAYTTRYADDLARAGFITIHPNLRGHGLSQGQPEPLFRIAYATEILDLAAMVRKQAAKPGPLQKASGKIGVLGHSMGGGITLRVITVDPKIQAAVLYAAMSGDERKNAERIYYVFSSRTRGKAEMTYTAAQLQPVSPINYLSRIQAAVSIHHGTADEQVPYAWSVDLCQRLTALGKHPECYSYPGAHHTFSGQADALFMQRVRDFFKRTLK